MDIRWLEDFLTLAEQRSFSRAASVRNITQPAFGRHIRALEERVGQELVDRRSIPVSLTPAGAQFRLLAHSIVSQMREGLQQMGQSPLPQVTPIRFSSPHSLSSPFLLDLLEQAEQRIGTLPFAVDILRVDMAILSLIEGSSDFLLAFDHHALLQPPFINRIVGQGEMLLVSAPNAQGQPLFVPDSQQPVPYLSYTADSYSARMVERVLPQFPFQLCMVFESSLCDLHRQMALRGKGITWLPDCQIRDELRAGLLVPVDAKRWSIPYQIRLYRNQGRLHQCAEQFWQQLTEMP